LLCASVELALGTDFVLEEEVRDREALLELWQAVGTGSALLAVAWAAIELVIGVDLLGILAFAVLASIAIAAVVMIFIIQSGWFPAHRGRRSGEYSASRKAKQSLERKNAKAR
jgi:hypothetical protein